MGTTDRRFIGKRESFGQEEGVRISRFQLDSRKSSELLANEF